MYLECEENFKYNIGKGVGIRMETKSIQEFLTLAKLGSSYATAEKLFVSQSSLIRHIQALEEEFGVALFDRTKKGFVLNANGRIFLPYMEKIAMTQMQCYNALHHDNGEANVIRVFSEIKIIELIIDFKKEFPQYTVELQKFGNIEEVLRKGVMDVAFLATPPHLKEDLVFVPFCREEALVLLYDTHPFAKKESVRLEELRGEQFIALCDDTIFNEAFIELYRKVGYVQDISASVPTGNDLMKMVGEKLGITLIHGKAETVPAYPGLRTIPLEPKMEYEVGMYYRKDIPLSKAAETFISHVEKWRVIHKDVNLTMLD